MVYVIVDGENPEKVLLVKADSKEDVEKRIKLEPSEKVLGNFTSHEIDALVSSSFVVVSG